MAVTLTNFGTVNIRQIILEQEDRIDGGESPSPLGGCAGTARARCLRFVFAGRCVGDSPCWLAHRGRRADAREVRDRDAILTPSGDVVADLATISGYYRSLGNTGAKPELAAPWVFR